MNLHLRRVTPIIALSFLASSLVLTGCRPAPAPDASPTPAPSPAAAANTPATPPTTAANTSSAAPVAPETKEEKAAAPDAGLDLPDPVAIVEGEKISRADLQEAFNRALASSGINPDEIDPAQKMTGYREILDELIVDRLVSRKASSIEIKDADLEAEIGRVKGQFPNEEVFKAEMQKSGETESSFRETVKRMLQQQAWMKAQIGDKAKVPDADVKKFYDENKKEFEHPELVRASHILIRLPEDADEKTVAEKKKAAQAALERVTVKKEDFAAVAKETSEEPGAKESGGDINFFPKDRMVPEFADAAFSMKTGETSKAPVRTKFGWHVIKVTGRKPAGTMPFEEVKQQVASYLEGAKQRDAVRNVIDGLRSDAKVENNLPAAPKPPTNTGNN